MSIFNLMFYGGLILSILFLIATVVIFFLLDIRKAMGVVTGQTQKKAIEEIRQGGRADNSKKKKGTRGSRILARDIDVTDIGKTSHTSDIPKPKAEPKNEPKRNSDASESLAEKAAADARLAAARAAAKPKSAGDLDQESTEILTYSDTKPSKVSSEDPTSVLEEEQPTDVLTSQDSYEEDYNDNLGADADEATAVLKHESEQTEKEWDRGPRDYTPDADEEATDVLKSTSAGIHYDEEESIEDDDTPSGMYDNDFDEEEMTDVLKADTNSELSESDVHGTYDPETTSVLIAEMAPGTDSVKSKKQREYPEITVLYSETIVHTTESL